MTPLLRKGATQFIVEDDIPSLRPEDDSAKLGDKLEKALSKRYFLHAFPFIPTLTLNPVRCGKRCSSHMVAPTPLQADSKYCKTALRFSSPNFFAGYWHTSQNIKVLDLNQKLPFFESRLF